MSAHSAGPWSVERLDRNGQAVVSNDHIEIATCWHHCVGEIEQEMHANARLIAAAPDLLAAAQKCADEFRVFAAAHKIDWPSDGVAALLLAIEKAAGAQA